MAPKVADGWPLGSTGVADCRCAGSLSVAVVLVGAAAIAFWFAAVLVLCARAAFGLVAAGWILLMLVAVVLPQLVTVGGYLA